MNTVHTVKKETATLEKAVVDNNNYFTVDWNKLKEENKDIIAWIYVPGTGISYPVVQGETNDTYLRTTVKGEPNDMGSIFLDSANDPEFLDDNSIIYGHSVSEVGGMFTDLKEFESEQFFNNHPYFYLLTPNQNFRCEIMVFGRVNTSSAFYTLAFNGNEEQEVQEMFSIGEFTRQVDYTDKPLVTLSTCDLDFGFHSEQRLVLTGALSKYDEKIKLEENK